MLKLGNLDLKLSTYCICGLEKIQWHWKDYKQSKPIKHQQNNNSQQTFYILYKLDLKQVRQTQKK